MRALIKPIFAGWIIVTSLFSYTALADKVEIGKPLPPLKITDGGLLDLKKNGNIDYVPWSTTDLKGKPWIVQYIPARSGSGQINVPLNNALQKIDFPKHRCRAASIVDVSDHDWGTEIFIKGAMESNKKRTPLCTVIADNIGRGKVVWGYKDQENVTIVIDKNGIVKYEYIGQLNQTQIDNVIKLLNSLPGWGK